MKKIILFIISLISLGLFLNICAAGVVNLNEVLNWTENVMVKPVAWSDPISKVENWWLNMLRTIKLILSIVALAYLIYTWAMFIIWMWDETKMKDYKKHFYFTLIWLMFLNIPWSIYEVFDLWKINSGWSTISQVSNFTSTWSQDNVFFRSYIWQRTIEDWLMKFVEYWIIVVLFARFIMVWLNYMTSRWNDEKKKNVKNELLVWFLWIIFLGSIKLWREVAVKARIDVAQDLIFNNLINLWIFFAWPIALFFICWWWYFIITATWDEAKVKKWKSILINVFIAVLILLASYTVLYDFQSLKF